MKHIATNLILLALITVVSTCFQCTAWAQTGAAAKDEEAFIRQELERIIKEEPAQATEAKKALDALNQPESSPEGRQARNRRERGARRIVNGIPSHSYPAVGALLWGSDPRSASSWCTGTLVGCEKFLTAAHCIADRPSPNAYLVFFQELGFVRVKAIHWEKNKYRPPYFDLAMLTLEKPVVGIAPMHINKSAKPLNNSIATIVGFGRTGGHHFDYGIKREGSIKTSACPADFESKLALCWRYDADLILRVSEHNTCHGDSGGGIFMRDTEGARVVDKVFGVVSGGTDKNCETNDLSYNVDVMQYRDWIETAGEGRLSSLTCGTPLRSSAHSPVYTTIYLDAANAEQTLSIDIPPDSGALHISMNAEDDGTGKNEFAFVVNRGTTTSDDLCKGSGSGRQFAICTLEKPDIGTLTIHVIRKKGEGDVQITQLLTNSAR